MPTTAHGSDGFGPLHAAGEDAKSPRANDVRALLEAARVKEHLQHGAGHAASHGSLIRFVAARFFARARTIAALAASGTSLSGTGRGRHHRGVGCEGKEREKGCERVSKSAVHVLVGRRPQLHPSASAARSHEAYDDAPHRNQGLACPEMVHSG